MTAMPTTKLKPPYRHADKALKRLYKRAEALLQNMAVRADWDELNVINEVRGIYDDVAQQAEREFLTVAQKAYEDAEKEVPTPPPFWQTPTAMFVTALLLAYDDKTQYVFRHEWDRKRARLTEGLIAVNDDSAPFNSMATRGLLHRALRLLEGQLRQMADTVTDSARAKAFDDAGVDRVRWITQRDERVCKICRPRDNEVYPLDAVPPKHHNCRCYLIPLPREE